MTPMYRLDEETQLTTTNGSGRILTKMVLILI